MRNLMTLSVLLGRFLGLSPDLSPNSNPGSNPGLSFRYSTDNDGF